MAACRVVLCCQECPATDVRSVFRCDITMKIGDYMYHVELHKFLNFEYTTFKNIAYH